MQASLSNLEQNRNTKGLCVPYDPLNPDAQAICRGVLRLFEGLGSVGLSEVTLPNRRRVDVMALGGQGEISVVEIKSSVNDFRTDGKWEEYLPYCDHFYFAVSQAFPQHLIPDEVGLIVADGFGGAVLRDAPYSKLSGARRKALTLRYARLAATRLMSANPAQTSLLGLDEEM